MGDINQLIFIRQHAEDLKGPYLEVGSKDYGSTQNIKSIFAERGRYVGTDMESGPGVDIALDLTQDFTDIDESLGHIRFGTIFCLSVLEHCAEPFKMSHNLTRLLKPGGKVLVSAPFSWKFHDYPSDYWRFTHEGIKILFPNLEFDPEKNVSSTSRENEFRKLDSTLGKISFSTSTHWGNGHFLQGVSAKLLKLLSKIGILSWLSGYRYLLAPTNVFMIGELKEKE